MLLRRRLVQHERHEEVVITRLILVIFTQGAALFSGRVHFEIQRENSPLSHWSHVIAGKRAGSFQSR